MRPYRHRDIVAIRERAACVVRNLFLKFRERPERMPSEWAERLVCGYIAGMTDRYALAEHRRHFETTPELRYGWSLR